MLPAPIAALTTTERMGSNMAEKHLTCAFCGVQFSTDHKRKFCTKKCAEAHKLNRKREAKGIKPRWPDGIPTTQKDHTCVICGKTFRPKHADRVKCCSRECGFVLSGGISAARKGVRPVVRVNKCRCKVCGVRFDGRTITSAVCSDACQASYAKVSAYRSNAAAHQPKTRTCAECGAHFQTVYGIKLRIYCSHACGARAARRAGKQARRAERMGAAARAVRAVAVFERDAWRCQICGRKTLQSKRGTTHPMAPELDHIVPLSRGGDHSYANTQCACRACNAAKGASVYGQLHLFP